ncbi:MAG: hypothetical protein IPL65_07160 [Lewinellaceae bacterium]|nr:hypothetical protein [Lewinellaceae bacterium]
MTLTIYDETGRMLYSQEGEFAKGYNAFTLNRAEVNTAGVLYYKVATATDSGSMKMVEMK